MSIITRGLGGSATIITRGFGGWSSLVSGLREVWSQVSKATKKFAAVSRIWR